MFASQVVDPMIAVRFARLAGSLSQKGPTGQSYILFCHPRAWLSENTFPNNWLGCYPRASPSPAALAGRTGEMGSPPPPTHAAREPTHHAPTQARARCKPTRARGCKVACPTPLTLRVHVCLLASGACVRARALAARVSHRKPVRQKMHPRQPRGKMKKNTVCAMFSTQRRRPHLRKKSCSLDRRLARHF